MLTKYDISVSKDDIERVDTLRYAWKNLQTLAKEVQDRLLEVQPVFKNDLDGKVTQFKVDTENFIKSYHKVSSQMQHIYRRAEKMFCLRSTTR